MPLEIIRADIVNMRVDAIINAANTRLREGVGVCGAVFSCAGDELKEECDRIGVCSTGSAVMTRGYGLPARFIIHTAGPVWRDGIHGEEHLLASCYRESLKLAAGHNLRSVAFPLISTGALGFPRELALKIAVDTIGEFLLDHEMEVRLVVFDRESVRMTEKLYSAINQYIDDHYVEGHGHPGMSRKAEREEGLKYSLKDGRQSLPTEKNKPVLPAQNLEYYLKISEDGTKNRAKGSSEMENQTVFRQPVFLASPLPKRDLSSLIQEQHESFSQSLLRLIDVKGFKDADVYKRANIDRRLFSKIRGQKDYRPKKQTALALAIALRLNLDETKDLIGKAGYALTESSRSDVIVTYFIQSGEYNIFRINAALFEYDEDSLTA